MYEEEEAPSEIEIKKHLLGDGRMEVYGRGNPFKWAATSFLT